MSTADTSQKSVPLLDLTLELEAHAEQLEDAVRRVMESGQFILGPEVEAFENEAAEHLGVEHAVGVNSGTDALVIALRSMGVGPGDEVITTPFTFFATAESIGIIGAEPVFADIRPDTFNLDPRAVEEAITHATEAIVPVHLFGRPADLEALTDVAERHDLGILEDCAQSFGSRVNGRPTGSIGDAGAFSFFPTKNLGGFGDGGLITTDDDRIADEARKLRAHGGTDKYSNEKLGYNSRLDAIQAAVLRVKLDYVDELNAKRRSNARTYGDLLAGVDGLDLPAVTDEHVFHQYTLRVTGGRRDRLKDQLSEDGVSTKVYYPTPCHELPVYSERDESHPEAEQAAREALSLPIYPHLEDEDQRYVASRIERHL